jgi:hypothetical protein
MELKSEVKKDFFLGLVLLLGSGFIYLKSLGISDSPYEPLGAGFLPKCLSLLIFFGAIIILIQSLRKYHGSKITQSGEKTSNIVKMEPAYKKQPALAILLVISIFFYILFIHIIGFRLATFFFIMIIGNLLYAKEKKLGLPLHILIITLIALIMSLGLFYLFTKVLFVNLQ